MSCNVFYFDYCFIVEFFSDKPSTAILQPRFKRLFDGDFGPHVIGRIC